MRRSWTSCSALSFQCLSRRFDQASSFFRLRFACRCCNRRDCRARRVHLGHGLDRPAVGDRSRSSISLWIRWWSSYFLSSSERSAHARVPADAMHSVARFAAACPSLMSARLIFCLSDLIFRLSLDHFLWAFASGFWRRPNLLASSYLIVSWQLFSQLLLRS